MLQYEEFKNGNAKISMYDVSTMHGPGDRSGIKKFPKYCGKRTGGGDTDHVTSYMEALQ